MSSQTSANVFTYTEHNIQTLCDSFEKSTDTRPLILPTYTTYSLVSPVSNNDSFHRWLNMANKFAPSSILIYHESHLPVIAKLTLEESAIIQAITSHFWSIESKNELSIMVPPREDIHPIFRQNNGKVIVDYSNHPVLQKLQESTQSPIAVQSIYVNQIPCTSYGHFEIQYYDQPVHILKQEEPCKRGMESTVIDIDVEHKKIVVVRAGNITIDEIIDCIEETSFSNYTIHLASDPSKLIKCIQPLWSRRIYRTKWLSYPFSNDQIDELTKSTKAYLANCIFIDFGKQYPELASICWGYVDLSEYNELPHALYTFYDILHQLMKMNSIHPILFYDSFSDESKLTGMSAAIQTRLWNIENTKEELYIPYECLIKMIGTNTKQ
jgi:tRNA A37 threonylcarbamoyladenosine synthetase subunit TsaC/SUA5/YrdC